MSYSAVGHEFTFHESTLGIKSGVFIQNHTRNKVTHCGVSGTLLEACGELPLCFLEKPQYLPTHCL